MGDLLGPARSTLTTRSAQGIRDMRTLLNQLGAVQRDVSDMRKIRSASDDPVGIARVLAIDEQASMSETYMSAINDARSRMGATEDALSEATQVMGRIQELALQGVHGTLSADDRATVQNEIASLGQTLVQLANSRFGDDYLFSGTRSGTAAYASMDLTELYQGDSGAIMRQVGANASVRINITAEAAFEPAKVAIEQLLADLTSGTTANYTADIQGLSNAFDSLLAQRSALGSRMSRVDSSQSALETQRSHFEELRSSLMDVDLPEAALRLSNAENALNAALAVNARVMNLSIFDFLR